MKISVKNITSTTSQISVSGHTQLCPKFPFSTTSFILTGYRSFANALRRTLLEEIEVKVLNVEHDNFKSDDLYYPYEFVNHRLNLIPIDQTVSDHLHGKLKSSNTATQLYPTDVMIYDIEGCNIEKICNNQRLSVLNPSKSLEISHIKIKKGYGFEHSMFSPCGDLYFAEIDTDTYQFSVTPNPPMFTSVALIKKAVEAIKWRLTKIQSDYGVNTDRIQLTQTDHFEMKVIGESHTIGALLSEKIYQLDPTILLVNYSVPHPSSRVFILKLKDTAPEKKIKDAIQAIMHDLDDFVGYFK